MLQREYQPAKIIESIIEAELSNYSELEVFSTPYRNGREKGFVFSHYDGRDETGVVRPRHVFVSEARSSDSIQCVTSSCDLMFSNSEYENAVWFTPRNYNKAAQHVLDTLLGKKWRAA